jgi:hypothetical protein
MRRLLDSRGLAYNAYDITPDDQRFVMMRLPKDGDAGDDTRDLILVFVEKFFAELKTKMGN